jgi:polar amino acid transport system substrate-binding protein
MNLFKGCLFVIFSLCFSPFIEGAEPAEKIVVGTTSAYAPYVSIDEKGEYVGFDVDLANLIAQRLNKKLVLQDLGSMPSLLVALQKKKIDAIIWAMSITEDRRKEMEMIYYQGEKITEMPFLFWKEAPKGVAKIEDLQKLSNCTICVEAGSYQDSVLQKYPGLKVRYLDKMADSIMELKYHKALSTTVDNSLIDHLQSQFPELKVLYLPLPENQRNLGNGVCINKENPKLISQVNQIIDDLTKEGKIAELEKKWNLTY